MPYLKLLRTPFNVLLLFLFIFLTSEVFAKQVMSVVIKSDDKIIKVAGDREFNGYFDVAVEYGANGIGWMVYSQVKLPQFVETHLAITIDRGKTWQFVRTMNKSRYQTIIARGGLSRGVWRYETPTLVYDPTDLPHRHWKFFVHRYFSLPPHKKSTSLFSDGWIEYSYAANPTGRWSRPIRLFGKSKSLSRININNLHPSLKNMKFYNEPGSISHRGVLYMSFDASPTHSGLGNWEQRKVILIASKDHGRSWQYLGTLAGHRDASQFGYLTFTGSSLVKVKGKLYLFISPAGTKGLIKKNRGHDGTFIVPFKNIARAELKRESNGKLKVIRRLKPGKTNGGLSDYHEMNTGGGILFSQIDVKAAPIVFQIYSTGIKIFHRGK